MNVFFLTSNCRAETETHLICAVGIRTITKPASVRRRMMRTRRNQVRIYPSRWHIATTHISLVFSKEVAVV